MLRIIIVHIILGFATLPSAHAQTLSVSEMSAQQRADEMSAVQYYLDTLTALESLKYITEIAKNSTRPSDLAEELSGAEGGGRLLRGVSDSLRQLAEQNTLQQPAWVDRWERANDTSGLIRNTAALINMSAEFVEAVQNAESSTAADKLKSLANLIRNINKITAPNTPVGTYIGVVADIVEGIAHDAAIIEDATRRKNDAIELVNRLLVGEEYEIIAEDLAAQEIAELERRIERIEAQDAIEQSENTYQKRVFAEETCARQNNLNRQDISELRREMAAAKRAVQYARTLQEMDEVLVLDLQNRINLFVLNLADALADQTGPDPLKALNAVHRIARYEAELRIYEAEHLQLQLSVAERKGLLDTKLAVAQGAANAFQVFFESFDSCVRENLEMQGQITRLSYLRTVSSGGHKESITVSVSGGFVFPVKAILSPRSCPSGYSCNTVTRTLDAPMDRPTLVMVDALWCTGVTEDWAMDYQVHIEGADGFKSNPMPVSTLCMAQ